MSFWKEKKLCDMTDVEWESLCDGCGKCCLHKLMDEDTDQVYYTNVSCSLLDHTTGRCKDYANRFAAGEECLKLSKDKVEEYEWLPDTCAYKLLFQGKDLPSWHPLITGSHKQMHSKGMSVISMQLVYEDEVLDWEEHIINAIPK